MFTAVILVVTEEIEKADFERLLSFVSPKKQDRIRRFRFIQDATNCLLGDLLVRYELCRHYPGFDLKQIEICEDKYGKPYVNNPSDFHFNISHSGRFIAVVCSDKPAGIDIEIINPIEFDEIAARYFTPDEAEYIRNRGALKCFYEIWTKKESRIKYEGVGLSKELSSFSVLTENPDEDFRYHNIYDTDEAICHICTQENYHPLVEIIDSNEFIRKILMSK